MARRTPSSVNVVVISGPLKFQPKTFNAQSGTVTRVVVESDDSYEDRQGSVKERKVNVDVVAFGDASGKLAACDQGQHVTIHGKLQTSKKEKDGVTFFSLEVQALAVDVGSPGTGAGSRVPPPNQFDDDDFPL